VDTGAETLVRKCGKLQASLKAAGYTPNEIDAILTHIHTDHSGGWSKLVNWFPAATLYVGKPDVDFWFDRANVRPHVAEKYFDEAAKTVKPHLMVEVEIVLARQPFYRESPASHARTSGHSCYVAASESIEFWAILFTLLRCNLKPEIAVAYDVDANAAAQRKKTVC